MESMRNTESGRGPQEEPAWPKGARVRAQLQDFMPVDELQYGNYYG